MTVINLICSCSYCNMYPCLFQDRISGQSLLSSIHENLKDHLICKGNKKFIMICGQPQGGYLSSVLCDLYYSDLERTQLREFQNDEDMLIRAVDDYLYITTDLDRAVRYVNFFLFPPRHHQRSITKSSSTICTRLVLSSIETLLAFGDIQANL